MKTGMQIGFSQRIKLEWLEMTAELCLTGNTGEEIRNVLRDMLRDKLSVGRDPKRGSREKVISILLRTWVSVPKGIEPLRDEGLDHLRRLPVADHLAVHWGMVMAAYPFVGLVAESVGRLLALQGSVAALQVQRRVREQLGERETVAIATRRVLRSFVDWCVLEDASKKGVYRNAAVYRLSDKKLVSWLIEATLVADGAGVGSLKAISRSPSLFPFQMRSPDLRELEGNSRLEVFRQGLDEEIIRTRRGRTNR